MPLTNTDAILWYNVGIFGEAGYAVPNWSNDIGSLNPQILDWTDLVGRNLFYMMHHEDADLRIPPSINTIKRVHKLYLRAGNLLAGRAVPPGVNNMEVLHARPAGEVFRVYPVPYFKVRNPFLRRWAGLILVSLAEAMQHTENRKEVEISTAFAGLVGQYIKRVYVNMAVELFARSREEAGADGFALSDDDFAAYNPGDFFTQTEMVDTVPRLDRVMTEDRLELLAEGIPVTQLPAELGPWPTNLTNFYGDLRRDATIGEGATTTGGGRSAAAAAPAIPELCEWPEAYFNDHLWFEQWPRRLTIKTMALDPSKGRDARRGDYSAYVMLGIDPAGVIYVEADLARRPTPQMVADGVAWCGRFRPLAFGVEANQYQELLAGEVEAEFRRQGVAAVVPAAIHNHVNKQLRIRRLGPYLSQGRLRFRAGCASTQLLVNQLRDFPAGAHDDGPDALEMALRLAEEVWHGRQAGDGLGGRLALGP